MTREECKAILEAGGSVSCYAWTFYQYWMHCGNDYEDGSYCCEDHYGDVEECLEEIEHKCEGAWSEVH